MASSSFTTPPPPTREAPELPPPDLDIDQENPKKRKAEKGKAESGTRKRNKDAAEKDAAKEDAVEKELTGIFVRAFSKHDEPVILFNTFWERLKGSPNSEILTRAWEKTALYFKWKYRRQMKTVKEGVEAGAGAGRRMKTGDKSTPDKLKSTPLMSSEEKFFLDDYELRGQKIALL